MNLIVYCRDDGNLSMQAEKDEGFRSKSKKEAIFSCFSFNIVNIGLIDNGFENNLSRVFNNDKI